MNNNLYSFFIKIVYEDGSVELANYNMTDKEYINFLLCLKKHAQVELLCKNLLPQSYQRKRGRK